MTKCPACGSENAPDAQWCDFCKEPFNKKKKPEAAEPEKPGLPPGVAAKLKETLRDGVAARPGVDPSIPAEFQGLDAGERVPTLPPWVRPAAWALVGLWVFWGMVLLGYYMGKARVRQAVGGNGVPIPASVHPAGGPMPGPPPSGGDVPSEPPEQPETGPHLPPNLKMGPGDVPVPPGNP